jgi:hypothetical protein
VRVSVLCKLGFETLVAVTTTRWKTTTLPLCSPRERLASFYGHYFFSLNWN